MTGPVSAHRQVSSSLGSPVCARRLEVQGISQRARQRRLRSQHSRGGLFPLPHLVAPEELSSTGVTPCGDFGAPLGRVRPPRYACQRRRRRILRTRRVNTMVDIVNRLACAPASEGPIGHVSHSQLFPSASQAECLASFSAKLKRAGQPPTDLPPSAALAELLQAKDLYSQEPQHLASCDPDLLKILQSVAQPRCAKTL